MNPEIMGYGVPAGGRLEVELVSGFERDPGIAVALTFQTTRRLHLIEIPVEINPQHQPWMITGATRGRGLRAETKHR